VRRQRRDSSKREEGQAGGLRTLEFALDLHDLLAIRVLDSVGAVDVEVFLANVEEVRTLQIRHLLAAGDGHPLAFDLQERLPVRIHDVEAITTQGQDFLLQDQNVRVRRGVLGEDAQWLRDRWERHDGSSKVRMYGGESTGAAM
jgi:hypothetical protein